MSRYCGSAENVEKKFKTIDQWKTECFLGNGSLLSSESIWNKKCFGELVKHYVENLDEGDGNFSDKLEGQLANAPESAQVLCAELMWLMLFCPNNIRPKTKRENINKILGSTNTRAEEDAQFFSDDVLSGFGSGGVGYNQQRWRELVYAVILFHTFYSLSDNEQHKLASSAIEMREWLETIPDNDNRQFRHMFLFMLFPDEHERIFGGSDRCSLLSEIRGNSSSYYKKKTARELDELLAKTRSELMEEYNLSKMDWYLPPIKALWQSTAKSGETERGEIFPTLMKFIEQSQIEDLTTRDYPKYHDGFEMRVSFGQGNQAYVTWIGLLGRKQNPQEGIYPAYLYFKEDNILILAKGISATRTPSLEWDTTDCQTIQQYFSENVGHDPIRYPGSYVYKAYDLSDELNEEQVESDLESLLAEYSELVDPYNIQSSDEVVTKERAPQEPAHSVEEVREDSPGYGSEQAPIEPFSFEDLMKDLFVPTAQVNQMLDLLHLKKNIILQGPPGVGKTFVSKRLAYGLLGEKDSSRVGMVQFHQSYSYEDFIQGYRPSGTGFELKNGLFYQFCKSAQGNPDKKYVFIIDEINRGNLSKVFGELMMLIEADKRGEGWAMPLTYSKNNEDKFHIPENLYIIGLMNTADRSLAVVDYALRRRFAFIDLEPQFNGPFKDYLRKQGADTSLASKIIKKMSDLNQDVEKDAVNLGKGYCIGHSFFCSGEHHEQLNDEWYRHVIKFEIEPLIREYWFDNSSKADQLINELLAD